MLGLMAVGLAVAITGCGTTDNSNTATSAAPAVAHPATPPLKPLPPIPAAHPGTSTKVDHVIGGSQRRICLSVDDGFNSDVVAGYVDFVKRSGIHLTFSPNGAYGHCWAPHAEVIRPLLEAEQVQIMNHTYSHLDLRKMSDVQITTELERNDEWVRQNFGITTRPYYRPPFGYHNQHVDAVAAGIGYTKMVLWDGSYSDSEIITPEFLMSQAQKYLQPGVLMLGHANHPAILGLFDQIMDLIKQRDLTPVTLDEMFGTSRATG